MKKTFYAFVTVFLGIFTLAYAVFVIFLTLVGLRSRVDYFIQIWARIINSISRIDLKVEGLENVPEGACLFVFNHMSLFDIPIVLATIKKRIRFGAKKELFYIPIFGQAMTLLGILKIDRGNRSNAIRALDRAKERAKKGESFILAAEGTRQKKNEIGEFKSGPFILSINAQCPIVPIVIYGAFDVLPKTSLFMDLSQTKKVRLRVLPPLSTQGLVVDDRYKVKEAVREKMMIVFNDLKNQSEN